jgi:surface antigen
MSIVAAQPAAAMSIETYGKLPRYPYITSSTSGVDPLRYYKRECVSFAAWWILRHNHKVIYFAHGAGEWKTWAITHHYAVDRTATIGAVAWWSGHVAVVLNVVKKSSRFYMTIGEYNFAVPYRYGERTIVTGSNRWPKAFLHIGR